jgi:hypothetical protein
MLTCLQIEIAASIRSDVWLPYPALCSTTPPHAAVCCCLQVQQLAVDLGLDRSEVLTWIAAFRAAPREEQRRQLAPLQGELAAARAAAAAAAQTADAVRAALEPPSPAQQLPLQQQQQQQLARSAALPFSGRNADTGFVPFAQRRGAAAAAGAGVPGAPKTARRLPAEVLRTLEGVYGRSPWPGRETVAGLFDLHRLPRCVIQARTHDSDQGARNGGGKGRAALICAGAAATNGGGGGADPLLCGTCHHTLYQPANQPPAYVPVYFPP